MTHAYGLRSGTRYKFAKGFRKHGMPALGRYLAVYKRGDYVTIKADGAIQKGMPHSFYHGRTGVVYDITKLAIGVEIPKRVGNREILKRFHVRVEHVFKSRCREEFENRRRLNDEKRRNGDKSCLKRSIRGPRAAEKIVASKVSDISPVAFTESF